MRSERGKHVSCRGGLQLPRGSCDTWIGWLGRLPPVWTHEHDGCFELALLASVGWDIVVPYRSRVEVLQVGERRWILVVRRRTRRVRNALGWWTQGYLALFSVS